jgi:hypothetical protein
MSPRLPVCALAFFLFFPVTALNAEESGTVGQNGGMGLYRTLQELFQEEWDVLEVRGRKSVVTVQTNLYKVDRSTYLSMIKKFCAFFGSESSSHPVRSVRALEIMNNFNKQGWSFIRLEGCRDLSSLAEEEVERTVMGGSVMILGNTGGIFIDEFTRPRPQAVQNPQTAGKKENPGNPAPPSRTWTCRDFRIQAEAQQFFINSGGPKEDPHGLDEDKDGVACEDLPWK